MDASIHEVQAIAVFREKGYVKICILAEGKVNEINVFGLKGQTPLITDTNNRCPVSREDFWVEPHDS